MSMSGFPASGLRAIGIVVAAGLVFGVASASVAQDAKTAVPAEAVVSPSDPVAKAAFDVLDKHCAR